MLLTGAANPLSAFSSALLGMVGCLLMCCSVDSRMKMLQNPDLSVSSIIQECLSWLQEDQTTKACLRQ